MKYSHRLSHTLVGLGALNWGLIGILEYNLIARLSQGYANVEQLIYILIGISAVHVLTTHNMVCRVCDRSGRFYHR